MNSPAPSFAIYRPARDRCEDGVLLTGLAIGSPQEALDTACRVHLAAPDTNPNPDPDELALSPT